MSNELPQDDSEELSDEIYYNVDMLTIEVFSIKSQLKAMEELLLANCALHPEVTSRMRNAYAKCLTEEIPLLQLIEPMLLTEEGSDALLQKVNSIRKHALALLEGQPDLPSSLAN